MPGKREPASALQRFGQRDQDHRSDHRTPDRSDAAEHGDRQRLRRHQHAEHGLRGHHQQHDRVEAADRAGDGAAERDGAQLPGQRVDAGGFRGGFVLLDREQRHAEARSFDRPRQQDRSEHHRQRQQRVESVIGELHIGDRHCRA